MNGNREGMNGRTESIGQRNVCVGDVGVEELEALGTDLVVI